LSGVKLDGHPPVRLVYLDESGTSREETVTVVAGVIVDPDKQWMAVERYIDQLIADYVPEEHQIGFVFHATEIFSGSKIFDPRTHTLERRLELLKKLVGIPAKFHLPTVYGYQDKTILPFLHHAHPKRPRQVLAAHQALTYSYAVIAAERFMREFASPEELATLTVENNDHTRQTIQKSHDLLRGGDEELLSQLVASDLEYLPVRKIIDCINFASKEQAIMLQLADACAFIYRRYLEKKPYMEEFCDVITKGDPKTLEPESGRDGPIDGYKILYFPAAT
jgi:hypothetical protein